MAKFGAGRSDFAMSPTVLLSCFFPQADPSSQTGSGQAGCTAGGRKVLPTPLPSSEPALCSHNIIVSQGAATPQAERRQAQPFDWPSEATAEMPQSGAV